MSLEKRCLSHSTTFFTAWLCTLPCSLPVALLCCCICKTDTAEVIACAPCLEDQIGMPARYIARSTLIFEEIDAPPKLKALVSKDWNPAVAFDSFSLATKTKKILEKMIYNILNKYNFGKIRSEDLIDSDMDFISMHLRTAIFNALPAPDVFHQTASAANKSAGDLLIDALTEIVKQKDFIKNQLNIISDQLTLKRSSDAMKEIRTHQIIQQSLQSGQPAEFKRSNHFLRHTG